MRVVFVFPFPAEDFGVLDDSPEQFNVFDFLDDASGIAIDDDEFLSDFGLKL